MSKDLLARALQNSLGDRLLRLLERADGRRANLFKVLTYHRVNDAEGFNRQMEYLVAHYHVLSMPDLLSALREGRPLPPFSVMITFDDAYRSFEDLAWPVLKRHRLPVTLFVPTGFPDHPQRVFWWDRILEAFEHTARRDPLETPLGHLPMGTPSERKSSLKRMKAYLKDLPQAEIGRRADEVAGRLGVVPGLNDVLGWEALRRLSREGVTLGAHSRNHPLMDRITAEEARAEVAGSLEDLNREIGQALPIFSYPDGRYRPETVEAVRQAGIALAFTTRRGANVLGRSPPLELRRINISRCSPTSVLRMRLIHSSVYLNRWQPLYDA